MRIIGYLLAALLLAGCQDPGPVPAEDAAKAPQGRNLDPRKGEVEMGGRECGFWSCDKRSYKICVGPDLAYYPSGGAPPTVIRDSKECELDG